MQPDPWFDRIVSLLARLIARSDFVRETAAEYNAGGNVSATQIPNWHPIPMRSVIAVLSTVLLLSATFGDEPRQPAIKVGIQDSWNRDAAGKLPAARRIRRLATEIKRDLKIDSPLWWRQRIEADIARKRSSAAPPVERNASVQRRGLLLDQQPWVLAIDQPEYRIDTLDGESLDDGVFVNVYSTKQLAYVFCTGGTVNPFPVYKFKKGREAPLWHAKITCLPTPDIMGMAEPHLVDIAVHDETIVVFGYSPWSTAYAFAINDSDNDKGGQVKWQFAIELLSGQ